MGPQAKPPVGGQRQDLRHEPPSDPSASVGGVHRKLRAAALDGVGRVDVGVAGYALSVVDQDVPYGCVTAVPKVKHDVLRQRSGPVMLGGPLDEHGHLPKLLCVEVPDNLDAQLHAPDPRA